MNYIENFEKIIETLIIAIIMIYCTFYLDKNMKYNIILICYRLYDIHN